MAAAMSAGSAAGAHHRADYGVHFTTQFPHNTTIMVEVPAGNDADAVAAVVERVFAGGLATGVFVSTRKESVSASTTVDDVSSELAACARAASARCPRGWVGVRPRHLPHGSQFGWTARRCPSAAGLWADEVIVDPSRPTDKRNTPARGLWQEVSTARAMGKWHGLVFATPHPTTLGLTRAVGKAPRDDAFAVATGDSDGLGQVSAALSFVADCVLVDCDSSSPLCRSQLAGLQRLRQAFLAVVPAPTCEADLRASVGNVADLVDGMVVRCPAEFPDGDARSYYDDLNRWLHSVLFGNGGTSPTAVGSDDDPLLQGALAEGATAALGGGLAGDVVASGDDLHDVQQPPDVPPVRNDCRSWLDKVLSQTLRVEISDGRVIYGRLLCTDRDLNLVLGHAEEHGPAPSAAGESMPTLMCRRQMGVVMVPGKHIVSCSVDATM